MNRSFVVVLACRNAAEMSLVLTIQLKVSASVNSRRRTQKIGVDAIMSSLSLTSSVYPFATILALTLLPFCRRTHLDLITLLCWAFVRLLKGTSVYIVSSLTLALVSFLQLPVLCSILRCS